MGSRGDHAHRLTDADAWRFAAGETFATAAAAVGCSTKSIQRFIAKTGEIAAASTNSGQRVTCRSLSAKRCVARSSRRPAAGGATPNRGTRR
jgi:hypothetical protein